MKKITKENGITLITLSVTIIIIFILAIVSILQVIDKEGILQDSNLSKERNLENTAQEQIELACSALKVVIGEAVSKDGSYSAKENSGLIHKTLIDVLNADIMSLDGIFYTGEDEFLNNVSEFKVVYKGQDYANICKYENARIIYTIEVTQRDIQLKEQTMIRTRSDEPEDDSIVDNTINNEVIKKYTDLGRSIILVIFMATLIILIIIIAVVMFVLKQKDIKKEISKKNSIKDTAREIVKDVCKSINVEKIRIDDMTQEEFLTALKNSLIAILNENKENLTGEFKDDNNITPYGNDAIYLIYEGEDYKASNNTGKSKIRYVIGVEGNELNLVKEDSTVIGIN